MDGNEVPLEEQQKVAAYTVMLSSCGNPDFDQHPGRSLPGVRKATVKVDTMAAASKACRDYITENGLGGGNWAGGQILLDGEMVARVSYNGRVWRLAS
jgi:hypothetical protein